MHCRSSTAHYPQVGRQCVAGIRLPTAPTQCGSALQEFRFLGSDRLLGRIPRPPSWWGPHIAGVPLPTTPRQCDSAL